VHELLYPEHQWITDEELVRLARWSLWRELVEVIPGTSLSIHTALRILQSALWAIMENYSIDEAVFILTRLPGVQVRLARCLCHRRGEKNAETCET